MGVADGERHEGGPGRDRDGHSIFVDLTERGAGAAGGEQHEAGEGEKSAHVRSLGEAACFRHDDAMTEGDRIAQLETDLAALKKRIGLMALVQSFTLIALSLLGIAFSMSRLR
jgi:hypothetical protein